MSNFFVPTFFHILPFCLFIGISTADPQPLSEDPNKFCNICYALANSPRFATMIDKLHEKIPITSRDLIWDKNVNVKYSSLLTALQTFMSDVKKHTEVLKKVSGAEADPMKENGYEDADQFVKTHRDLIRIMKEKHRNKEGVMSRFSGHFTVEGVLNEALQCAHRVSKLKAHFDPVPMLEADIGAEGKLSKHDCIKLDDKFKEELQKVWVLSEPPNLYSKCHKLSESDRFSTMVAKLKDRIPIEIANWAGRDEKGKVNYANLMAVMKSFLDQVAKHKAEKLKHTLIRDDGEKQIFDKWANPDEHILANAFEFLTAHQALIDILAKKCGIKESLIGICTDTSVTVEYVLKEGLECAVDVHQFRKKILAFKKIGANKKLPYEANIAELDGKFEAMLTFALL